MSDEQGSGGAQGQGGTQSNIPIPGGHQSQQRPESNPRGMPTSPAMESRARMAGAEPAAAPAAPAQQPGTGEKVRVGDIEVSPTDFAATMQRMAEDQVRKASLPATPDGYKAELPPGFQLPPGSPRFEFNQADPQLKQLRELAHRRGLDQGTVSDLLGIHAANRIAELTTIESARQAEIQKLGATKDLRIGAVTQWIDATVGSDLGAAMRQMLVTAKHVEGFERIISRFTNQGAASAPGNGRDNATEVPAGSIHGFENMSFTQRRMAQMAQLPPQKRGR